MSAEQLINEANRHTASSAGSSYAMALCLRELSQPRRYRDELGFANFAELLVARSLPTRVTAHKLITVASIFSEPEVRQLGGMDKSFALVRFIRGQSPNADPRRLLTPGTRVLGRALGAVSARELGRVLRGDQTPTKAETTAAKNAASRLASALRRAGVAHRSRVHAHRGTCISFHFDPEAASQLATLLKRLRKLEEQLQDA
jgi:hypothetical protein